MKYPVQESQQLGVKSFSISLAVKNVLAPSITLSFSARSFIIYVVDHVTAVDSDDIHKVDTLSKAPELLSTTMNTCVDISNLPFCHDSLCDNFGKASLPASMKEPISSKEEDDPWTLTFNTYFIFDKHGDLIHYALPPPHSVTVQHMTLVGAGA